ncbi:hypothetical protein ABNN70_06900 [Sporolactobacillus sp. Y61]|uniref:Transposase n=1 Tax=Sporolactobacillus sp. Y61 TaxID=3160863 RepID=A0AAU8IIB5_9BACL
MRHIKYIIALNDDEVTLLEKIFKDKTTSQTTKKRSQILLDADVNHGKTRQRKEIAK